MVASVLIRRPILPCLLFAVVTCLPPPAAASDAPSGTASHGRDIYNKRCVVCHAAGPAQEEGEQSLLRAGHPLAGAAYRGSWWNGKIATDAGDASDYCFRTYVDPNSEGLEAAERKALVLFMQALGSDTGISPMTLLRRNAGDVDLRTGDAARGAGLYRRACVACHGGSDAAAVASFIEKTASSLSPSQVADVIRRGSGLMPFFQVDRLTAQQVADIALYVESRKPAR